MKEKIIEIIIKHTSYTGQRPQDVREDAVDAAEEIFQLRIECPDTEEIKAEAQKYSPLNGWEKDAFKAGANYIKNEIAKRNQ